LAKFKYKKGNDIEEKMIFVIRKLEMFAVSQEYQIIADQNANFSNFCFDLVQS